MNLVSFCLVGSVNHFCSVHQETQCRASHLSQLWCGLCTLGSDLAFRPSFLFLPFYFPIAWVSSFTHFHYVPWLSLSQ